MRKLLISLLALFALAACSSGGSDTATQEATQTPAVTETATPSDVPADVPATTTETAAATVQTGEIEIAGTVGCGHCAHSSGETCSAAVQTADGAVYILEGVGEGDVPFEQRFDGKSITVHGDSVERDGVGYVTVASFEL
jgi:hypothetical protein